MGIASRHHDSPIYRVVAPITLISIAMFLLLQGLNVGPAKACQGEVVRCSVSYEGIQGNGLCENSSITPDGKYIAFISAASNLVPGDTNGVNDVFRKNLETKVVDRCSISQGGVQANGDCERVVISDDGRYVAFCSAATNLISGDTNSKLDVFRKDMGTGEVKRCSTSASGVQGDLQSYRLSMSADGRHVTFESNATNLVTGDTNGQTDIFRKDLSSGNIIRCSLAFDGQQANAGSSQPSISRNGRYIVFCTTASNLVAGDTNNTTDVFRFDCDTGGIVRCSTTSTGAQANNASLNPAIGPAISQDGRYVIFHSTASNLVEGDTNGVYDAFYKDLDTNNIVRYSKPISDSEGNNHSYVRCISPGGRYLLFESDATNIVSNDGNNCRDVFRYDLSSGSILRVSTSFSDEEGNGGTSTATLTSNGTLVAFTSSASNLVAGDTNGVADVFVKDLSPPSISSISPASGVTGTEVTIDGAHFGPNRASSYVTFGSKKATTYTSWSDAQIKVAIPYGIADVVEVKVITELGASNAKSIETFPTYYFAEGYTGVGFHTWLCLQNPNTTSTNVNVTYMFEDGYTQDQRLSLPARSRQTINVNETVGVGRGVSIRVTSEGGLIIAERPMYFAYNGMWTGGHCVIGATAPSKTLYFAEGYTAAGFVTYLCLQNPNDSNASVDITYMFPDATPVVKSLMVPPQSRYTLNVNQELGIERELSIRISSNLPIVAERPMYFVYDNQPGGMNWDGGHCVLGTPSPSKTLYFAEGYTGAGFKEYLCIQNPNSSKADIRITYMFRDRPSRFEELSLQPNSRYTRNVNAFAYEGIDVSIRIDSSLPLVAERPMYFSYLGKWDGGHDVMATSVSATQWYFAEGYTGDGFTEYITLQNPGSVSANVEVMYLLEASGPVTRNHIIAPNSRYTIMVNGDLGGGLSHSTLISSDSPIIAERPMYFAYQDAWDGGHCVIGYGR